MCGQRRAQRAHDIGAKRWKTGELSKTTVGTRLRKLNFSNGVAGDQQGVRFIPRYVSDPSLFCLAADPALRLDRS
jgi:hypothetical protein